MQHPNKSKQSLSNVRSSVQVFASYSTLSFNILKNSHFFYISNLNDPDQDQMISHLAKYYTHQYFQSVCFHGIHTKYNYGYYNLRFQKFMQANLWNLKNGKQIIGIREKTQAHKRHLIHLVNAKNKVDDQNKEWKLKSLNGDLKKKKQKEIINSNRQLSERIAKVESAANSNGHMHSRKFTQLTENLHNLSNIHRYKRLKLIEEENARLHNRLVSAQPTLPRESWIKTNKENNKYKLNIARSKYSTPNYSLQVSRVIENNNNKVTFKHLKMSKFLDSLPNVQTERSKTVRA